MGKEKTARFNMVMTPDERTLIEAVALEKGATLSGFVRGAALREVERWRSREKLLEEARRLLVEKELEDRLVGV